MFRPEEFLSLAERLIEQSDDEATLRTVISRAYYSVFLTFRNSMGARGASHKRLWESLEETAPEIANYGQRFRLPQNSADYGDHIPQLRDESRRAVLEARRMLEG